MLLHEKTCVIPILSLVKFLYRKEDIHIEATKGLRPQVKDDRVFPKPEVSDSEIVLPKFTDMIKYIKEKVSSLST